MKLTIEEFEIRRPMNRYFNRIEADIYQRISQGTGIDNYGRLFELLSGKSFKNESSFKTLLEPIQVLFQLRNVIAHSKEVSAYEVSAYWNNNTFEENFSGGYKKAEMFLIKNGLLQEGYVKTQSAEQFFTDSVANYFYNISRQFCQQLQIFVDANLEVGDILINKLNQYNKENNSHISIIDFCELNAQAIKE